MTSFKLVKSANFFAHSMYEHPVESALMPKTSTLLALLFKSIAEGDRKNSNSNTDTGI